MERKEGNEGIGGGIKEGGRSKIKERALRNGEEARRMEEGMEEGSKEGCTKRNEVEWTEIKEEVLRDGEEAREWRFEGECRDRDRLREECGRKEEYEYEEMEKMEGHAGTQR